MMRMMKIKVNGPLQRSPLVKRMTLQVIASIPAQMMDPHLMPTASKMAPFTACCVPGQQLSISLLWNAPISWTWAQPFGQV